MASSIILAILAACTVAASIQKPLVQKDYGIPLLAFPALFESWVYYGATLGVGSGEGQLFNAIIDINTGGTYLESTRCRSPECLPRDHMQYNHSSSTTYHKDGTAANYTGYTFSVRGILSHDTLRLGHDLVIPNHTFIETTWSSSRLPHRFDSVVGLSPSRLHYYYPQLQSNISFPGVFEEYMGLSTPNNEQRNMFSLLAPYFPGRLGDLSIGTTQPDLYKGELVRHDIYPPGADFWQLKAPSVRVFNSTGEKLLDKDFGNYVVHIDSTVPGIWLPKGSGIGEAIGRNPMGQDCDDLDSLPTVVLDFDGQEIVLEGKDYYVKSHSIWNDEICAILIGDMKDEDMVDRHGNDFIFFGTDFLKMVYAVFDWDDRSISFAKPNREVIPFSGSPAEFEDRFRPLTASSFDYRDQEEGPDDLVWTHNILQAGLPWVR